MKNSHRTIKNCLCKHKYISSIHETPYAYEVHKKCIRCGKKKVVRSMKKGDKS